MTPCRGRGRTILLPLVLLITTAILVWLFLMPPPIVIRWQTETEMDTVAFNVLRVVVGINDFDRVNTQPIPAEGSTLTGADYVFIDRSVQRGQTYTYHLQELTSQGEQITYPWAISARAQRSWLDIITSAFILAAIWGWWLLGCRKRAETEQIPIEAS